MRSSNTFPDGLNNWLFNLAFTANITKVEYNFVIKLEPMICQWYVDDSYVCVFKLCHNFPKTCSIACIIIMYVNLTKRPVKVITLWMETPLRNLCEKVNGFCSVTHKQFIFEHQILQLGVTITRQWDQKGGYLEEGTSLEEFTNEAENTRRGEWWEEGVRLLRNSRGPCCLWV